MQCYVYVMFMLCYVVLGHVVRNDCVVLCSVSITWHTIVYMYLYIVYMHVAVALMIGWHNASMFMGTSNQYKWDVDFNIGDDNSDVVHKFWGVHPENQH